MIRSSKRALVQTLRALPLLAAGCAGESVRHVPPCKAAWQEILLPDELMPFYPQAAVWHSNRLYLLSTFFVQQSREMGLIYDPRQGFTPMPETDVAKLSALASAVAVGEEIVFLSDPGARFNTTSNTWSDLPALPGNGYVGTAASLGGELMVTYNQYVATPDGSGGTLDESYLTYAPGDDAWGETSKPPRPRWVSPALAWTGSQVLAWGGRDGENTSWPSIREAARYEPASDSWHPMSEDGAPASPGGRILWTDPEAVAWGEDPASAGRYDPVLDRWRPVSPSDGLGITTHSEDSPIAARGHVLSWSGPNAVPDRIGVYDPNEDTWTAAPTRCGPSPRFYPLLLWTDDGLIFWGGPPDCSQAGDGACSDTRDYQMYFLPAPALFGEVHDVSECSCPEPRERIQGG